MVSSKQPDELVVASKRTVSAATATKRISAPVKKATATKAAAAKTPAAKTPAAKAAPTKAAVKA
ncbi:MAG: hypothetical protein ABI232_09300, partial [Jatrophihabitantaceae bacterium]